MEQAKCPATANNANIKRGTANFFHNCSSTTAGNKITRSQGAIFKLLQNIGWSNYLEISVNQNTKGFTERIFDRNVKFIRNNVVSTSVYYPFQLNEMVPIGTSINTDSELLK
ncbi:hypothetical protein Glove_553g55 [Diversispora epigaea]|uniref:Uncharacterized protein n=1 Tax=Diversispora epigaea TaxID=1348612 RepID=A0A397GH04_9GLOM|nr:hypothetical protein Glove_553g55 [Diversispora epigaea]